MPFRPPPREALASVDMAEKASYESECRVVEGVVSSRNQCGWPRSADYDVHCFALANWRFLDEALVGKEMTLLRPVPKSSGNEPRSENIFERFPAYSVQRFLVLLDKDHTRAILAEVLKPEDADGSLHRFSERLRTPVVVSTKHFGDCVMDPLTGLFETTAKWNRRNVKLSLGPDSDGGIAGAIQTAEALWDRQAAWKRQIDDFAVTKLMPLKNESWLDDGEPDVKAADFKKRMKLLSVSVAADGEFSFWHADGDLFAGHAILVSGTLKNGPTDADIPG